MAERLDGEPEPGGVAYRLWRDMEDLQWQELYLPFVRGLAHATLPRYLKPAIILAFPWIGTPTVTRAPTEASAVFVSEPADAPSCRHLSSK